MRRSRACRIRKRACWVYAWGVEALRQQDMNIAHAFIREEPSLPPPATRTDGHEYYQALMNALMGLSQYVTDPVCG